MILAGVSLQLEHFALDADACALKYAAAGDSAGEIEGYASIFGELDQGNDVVVRGAFKKSLAERRKQDRWDIPMFFGHAHASVPIGVWTDFREDKIGLKCKGKLIFETPDARQVRAVILAGGGMGISIGYRTIKHAYVDATGGRSDEWRPGCHRELIEVDLAECSLTAMPMCRGAGVTSAKMRGDEAQAAAIRALEALGEHLTIQRTAAAIARALQG